MSKSEFGNSELYMTTREFADLVIEALNEQSYFKYDSVAHPQDIAYAFSTVGETIGSAMQWAIKQESQVKRQKNAVMKTGNLSKATKSYANTLPQDDEIAPALLEPGESVIPEDYQFDYSEWKYGRDQD